MTNAKKETVVNTGEKYKSSHQAMLPPLALYAADFHDYAEGVKLIWPYFPSFSSFAYPCILRSNLKYFGPSEGHFSTFFYFDNSRQLVTIDQSVNQVNLNC